MKKLRFPQDRAVVRRGAFAPPEFEVSERGTEREISTPRLENLTTALQDAYMASLFHAQVSQNS